MTIPLWQNNHLVRDPRVRDYIIPTRILWESNETTATVENAHYLLESRDGQASLTAKNACILQNRGSNAGLLLDFGKQLHGGIQISAWYMGSERKKSTLRVRFGESAMEAMSEIEEKGNATNDHAIRDQIVDVSFLGTTEIGNTGFRFVRIDLLDPNGRLELKSVRAVFLYRDIEYKGSFHSNDSLLNQIWQTGAYTVHLNMQDYLWDGIKRDRLVWIGDMHPETSTIQAVFGYDETVPKSLDFIRDITPLPEWMNTFPSYSIWWLLIHHDWYMHDGNLDYLRGQKDYMLPLLLQIADQIDEKGNVTAPFPFLDWPSSSNKEGVKAGIHALFAIGLKTGIKICHWLEDEVVAQTCRKALSLLEHHVPWHANSKQAAALLSLAGLMNPLSANSEVLAVGGSKGLSTFFGYYMLRARGAACDIQGSLDCIREYWGGMIKLGATTFWEDFDLEWLKDAARIDEITPAGKIDVHGSYGDHCYKGYRHSLCHGWASGPTAWLSEYVLGIRIEEPGCKAIRIEPELGDLDWVEGKFPTPFGTVHIKLKKRPDGSLITEVQAPHQVKVLRKE